MKILGGVLLALALASCYGHDRTVGTQPTPLSVKGGPGSEQQGPAPQQDVQALSAPDANELAKNGATCSADSDCTGRLRCVSYTGAAGHEMKQCLFPCGEGCPSGWNCQIVSDGPSNTCARAR